jgi:hypothetical protein
MLTAGDSHCSGFHRSRWNNGGDINEAVIAVRLVSERVPHLRSDI